VEPSRLAPRLNQHGAEILREAGYSAEDIATLVRDGVTRAAETRED
jgi:crotonobetainyl-CoA:carnitine CoA-transferase CaiB-like acyl-CoA transferase